MGDARRYFQLQSPFVLHRGGQLLGAQLAYETWGKLNSAADNAILIYTGMSPGAHAASSLADSAPGWWEDMLGPGKPIDTQRWFVICANSLGSCKGSTGPASLDPETGAAYRMNFPELSVEDIARANHQLVAQLGIQRLKAVIGCSMGGMSSLAHASLFKNHAEHAILVSTALRAEAFAIAIRSLQRQLVLADPNFQNGKYEHAPAVNSGMGLARKLGVISYRSAEEWRARFARQKIAVAEPIPADAASAAMRAFAPEFEVERYLQGHAERWAGSFDPCSYLYLSRAMDWFDLRPAAEGAALQSAACVPKYFETALVLGVASDLLFPLAQQAEIAQTLARGGTRVSFQALPSIQGHDAFLVDMENFGPAIAHYLQGL